MKPTRLPATCTSRCVSYALGAILLTALQGVEAAAQGASDAPALVVLLTVDQLRADYPEHFRSDLRGGFRRLMERGTWFRTTLQDHAITSTAPGHATLWSGRFPRNNDIISNDLGVPDPAHPLLGGYEGEGASPRRFRGTSLVDWMLAADSATRVLAVSRKDRGAILSVGAGRWPVFWWSKSGAFTTSQYYADSLPAWIRHWNARLRQTTWEGREWHPLLPAERYHGSDTAPGEGVADGRTSAFPHQTRGFIDLQDFPWMDSLTLDVALAGARGLRLGQRARGTDALAVSLSTLDAVGHDYGPDSWEVHDHLVRLDRWLGDFMTDIERLAAPRPVLFVLSSDHGVTSMPELLRARGEDAGRVRPAPVVRRFLAPLVQRYRYDFGVVIQDGLVLADTAAMRAREIDVDSVTEGLATMMRMQPGVERVYTPRSLAADDTSAAAGLWRRSLPPRYGWLIAAQPIRGWSMTGTIEAEHGTPLPPNVEVPLFLLGPRIPAQRVDRVVQTVDVAPTLAALLGIRPTEPVDGRPLTEVVQR